MNFFKLYIGDYQRDTAHMTLAEHGAYILMLQHYYATQKPLPTGKAGLYRMLRAQDKVEREAIDSIVEQFWQETTKGLINQRADKEIAQANNQAEKNREIAVAREAKRRANKITENLNNRDEFVLPNIHENSTNRATNHQPNHSHSHSHSQSKDINKHTELITDNLITNTANVCQELMKIGMVHVNPQHADLIDLVKKGATLQDFVSAGSMAIEKNKEFTYALGIVKSRLRDQQTAGVSHEKLNGNSKKLSLVEQGQAAEKRLLERQRRESEDRIVS